MDLQVIYTQDADVFRFKHYLRLDHPCQGNEFTERIRSRYRRLSEEVQLPRQVGVVTHNEGIKAISRTPLYQIPEPTTTFVPIDVFERVLRLREEDLTDPLTENYVYRTMALEFYALNSVSSPKQAAFISALCCMPSTIKLIGPLSKLLEEIEQREGSPSVQRYALGLREAIDSLTDEEGWSFIELAYQNFLAEFRLNQVSPTFPLHYSRLGEGVIPLNFSAVNLAKGVEESDGWFTYDRYGETTDHPDIDALLAVLPDPKTIITDLYFMSHFPQFSEEFTPHTHVLPDKPKNIAELLQTLRQTTTT